MFFNFSGDSSEPMPFSQTSLSDTSHHILQHLFLWEISPKIYSACFWETSPNIFYWHILLTCFVSMFGVVSQACSTYFSERSLHLYNKLVSRRYQHTSQKMPAGSYELSPSESEVMSWEISQKTCSKYVWEASTKRFYHLRQTPPNRKKGVKRCLV